MLVTDFISNHIIRQLKDWGHFCTLSLFSYRSNLPRVNSIAANRQDFIGWRVSWSRRRCQSNKHWVRDCVSWMNSGRKSLTDAQNLCMREGIRFIHDGKQCTHEADCTWMLDKDMFTGYTWLKKSCMQIFTHAIIKRKEKDHYDSSSW